MHMRNAVLHGPAEEPVNIDSTGDGDRSVLMPWNLPVGVRNLVEEQRANGEGTLTQRRVGQAFDG